jgi:hypothetical protein
VQGYLLARPVDASEAPLLLQRKWGARRSTQAPPSSHATVNSHVL